MLQIDHVYEFFYSTIFKDFDLFHCSGGVVNTDQVTIADIVVFTPGLHITKKIFFYDQEPLMDKLTDQYLDIFNFPTNYTVDELINLTNANLLPYNYPQVDQAVDQEKVNFLINNHQCLYKKKAIVTSEKSALVDSYAVKYDARLLYYFFHGFAALDWYRGFYALNYNKQVIKDYTYDYITFNRLVSNDRSYRCYFISLLAEELLLEHGQVSFGLATEQATWQEEIVDINTKLSIKAIDHIKLHLPSTPLIIDNEHISGSASADIPRCTNDSFWHIVTETVFYYEKLHLTEKIFKPIVMKQPFMLLAAPGNLAYLKSYGFKTFEGIIDESYDLIQDQDQRTEAVVKQLAWYCSLSAEEKQQVIEAIAPIVEYNFHHFYGEFKHIITRELLDNCRTLFKEIGYDDDAIAYDDIYRVVSN
jgi:hypothetical protein